MIIRTLSLGPDVWKRKWVSNIASLSKYRCNVEKLTARTRTGQLFQLSDFFWTIDYRYHIVPALLFVEAHEMSKSLNPNYRRSDWDSSFKTFICTSNKSTVFDSSDPSIPGKHRLFIDENSDCEMRMRFLHLYLRWQ